MTTKTPILNSFWYSEVRDCCFIVTNITTDLQSVLCRCVEDESYEWLPVQLFQGILKHFIPTKRKLVLLIEDGPFTDEFFMLFAETENVCLLQYEYHSEELGMTTYDIYITNVHHVNEPVSIDDHTFGVVNNIPYKVRVE